jgi:hypothetical protein
MNNNQKTPLGSKGIVNIEETSKIFYTELAEKYDQK